MTPNSFLTGFLEQVTTQPDATALIWHEERVSYAALYDVAKRVASRVRSQNIPLSQPIAVMAPKSPTAVGLVLGCTMAGHCLLLPPADLPAASRRSLLQRAHCAAVLLPVNTTHENTAGFELHLVERRVRLRCLADPGCARRRSSDLDDIGLYRGTKAGAADNRFASTGLRNGHVCSSGLGQAVSY